MDEMTYNDLTKNGIPPIKPAFKTIVLRGVVVFPGQTAMFDLGRDKSVVALNKAVESNQEIFLVAQKHANSANPAPKDIYKVGCLARIKQITKLPNDTFRVIAQCTKRMEIEKIGRAHV